MTVKKTFTASVLSLGLAVGMGTTAVLAISTHGAEARSSHAGENGKGQGGDRSSAKSGNASDRSNGHASGNSGSHGKPENPGSQGRGKLASQLKNLNAVCAVAHAGGKASSKSNIGKMWTYKGAYETAVDIRTNLASADGPAANLASEDPNPLHDTAYYADSRDVSGDITQATSDLNAALWPNDSTEYTDALDALVVSLADPTITSRDQLSDAQIASVVDPHNTAVHSVYDQFITDLGLYQTYLDEVVNPAETAERTTLTAATRGRTLDDVTLAAFQDKLTNGC